MKQYQAFRKLFFITLSLLSLLFVSSVSFDQIFKKTPVKKNGLVSPAPLSASTSAQLVRVKKIIDGDTIEIASGQKVRYIGIDTPELHHPTKGIQCFGREAMEENKKLIFTREIRLEKDVSETDKYGRLLRYAYVNNPLASSEAVFVNDYLVRQGYAYAATFPPDVKYSQQFLQAQTEARDNDRGLWKKCQ